MEDRLASQEARITALEASWEERVKAFAWWEDRMAAWEARVKTLERNNPLETRLRAVEALQATAVAKSYGASSWTIMPFAWLQFAFRWVGKFHQGIQVAVAQTISNQQPVPTNQRPLSTNLKQQPARVDSSASQSMAATSTLQVHPERELQDTNQSNWHPTLSESSEKGIDEYATLLKDSSMQDTFFEQKGLEGYSQSLVLTPSTADKLKSNRAKTSLLHREACKRRLDTYIDPESGYEVFTAHHLRTRDCCGSGCRHCPWGHRNVPGRHKAQNSDITQKQGHLVRLESWELGLSIEKPTSKNVIPKSRLYTRKGDAGYTNLYNEKWILKSEDVYDAIGDVDELNSAVGMAHALLSPGSETLQQLEAVQAWLLDIGSALCTPRGDNHGGTSHERKLQRTKGVTHADVTVVEEFIDRADAQVSELKNFILPGGTPAASALHVARTVCRRAERRVWPLLLAEHSDHVIGIFLNRLSDYLFVVARLEARVSGAAEKHYRIERKIDRWQRKVVNR